MGDKKQSKETAWKIAAIERRIQEAKLAGASPEQLAKLKEWKKRPGDLLTVRHLLPLPIEDEEKRRKAMVRDILMKRRMLSQPEGIETLMALDAEQRRVNQMYFADMSGQRDKARKPRPANDDGRTTLQLVIHVVKQHPSDAQPDDLLQHIHAEIEANGGKVITDKWAKELIRRARERSI